MKSGAHKAGTASARLTPSRVLRVYGMRRSGNHAIINWLQRNVPGGTSVFLNNCHPRRDPMRSHRSMDVMIDGALDTAEGRSTSARLARAGKGPVVFVSFDDTMPPPEDKPFPPLFERVPGGETVVLIYRSFLNWAASLLKKISANPAFGPIDRARVMMSSLSGYAAALDRVSERTRRGFVAICYDLWNSNAAYRVTRLSRLGWPVQDNTRGTVQRYGGGSSFQGTEVSADALNTDARSDAMAEDAEYAALLWTAARDESFMQRLAAYFPNDACRLAALAQNARLSISLPREVTP